MRFERELQDILNKTEKQLLEAISKAAQNGDLSGVDQARSIVGQIRRLSAELETRKKPAGAKQLKKKRGAIELAGDNSQNAGRYPIFTARNGTLYRLAWSRKKHSEYEHRVPKATIDLIATAMSGLARSGGPPVEVETIVTNINRSSVIQIPQYQVYLVVGWLRRCNCIEQIGRDGYRIPADISRLAEQEWKLLSSKQG